MSHRLAKFFPVPRFLDMRAAGIDISFQTVRIVKFSENNHGLVLSAWDEERIPPGSLYSTEEKDRTVLVDVLKKLKEKHRLHFVNVSMPEQEGYVFSLPVNGKTDKEIRQSIMFQLEENIPLKPDEAVFDYQILKENPLEVVVTAYPLHYVEEAIELCERAGLYPVGFYTAADAIARAVVPKHNAKTHIVVNFGTRNTGISIVYRNIVVFTSNLNFGTETLTAAIAKEFGVDAAEAEVIKKGEKDLDKKDMTKLLFSFLNPISGLRDEIGKVVQYWNSHHNKERDPEKEIVAVYLCGDDAFIPGLDDYLSGMLKLPVNRANVWVNALDFSKTLPGIHLRDSLNYPSAIGLALVSFQKKYE